MARHVLVATTFLALMSAASLDASAAAARQISPKTAKHAAAGGNATAPQKKTAKKMEKIVLEGVRLITPEKEIEANVETADMTRFVDEADTAVQYLMYASPQAFRLVIKFECTPIDKSVQVMGQGKPDEKLLALLEKLKVSLNNIQNLKVKSGSIQFSMQYLINA